MIPAWRFAFALLLVAVVSAPALWQDPHSTPEPYWSALTQSMEKMHATVALNEQSGDPDLDFARLMFAHHQAAIDMAKTELMYGKDAQMRRLAQEIIADQQSEIELMRLWLKRHDSRVPKPNK
jgi:uncharacterized protein (DUF305 family)